MVDGLEQPDALMAHFAEPICQALDARLRQKIPAARAQQALQLYQHPALVRLSAAEDKVEPQALEAYRRKLKQRPARAERLALIRSLNQASLSAQLSYQVRVQVGQTQLYWLLLTQGQSLSGQALEELTQAQRQALKQASDEGVESFLLYALRHISSAQLLEALGVYQKPELNELLQAADRVLVEFFTAKRAELSVAALQSPVAPPPL